jgi:hypothetical protein
MHKVSFIKGFILPEFRALIENKWKLLFLFFVVFLSFWGIGFSHAIKLYLKQKMDNPFVKFITINIPMGINLNDLKNDLDNKTNKTQFNYGDYSEIVTYIPNFKGINKKEPDAYIRAVKPNDQFYKFLINEPSIQLSKRIMDITLADNAWGCIVTEGYLRKLGYLNNNVSYITYINPLNGIDQYIHVPVAGVVKQLPDFMDCIVSEKLMTSIKGGLMDNPLDNSNYPNEKCVYFEGNISLNDIKTQCASSGLSAIPTAVLPEESNIPGIKVLFTNADSSFDFKAIESTFKNYKPVLTYDFNSVGINPNLGTPGHLSIPFNSLDSIKSFQNFIENKHSRIRIDMNTIEAKSNFNLFDKISLVLILLLSLFGALLLITLMLNTIMGHIEKNKLNLGTLKAFGMSNWSITGLYTAISAMLTILITIGSYLLAYVLGDQISSFLLGSIMGINIEGGVNLFILDLNIELILTFWLIPSLIVGVFVFSKLHKKTPGDLIYERD